MNAYDHQVLKCSFVFRLISGDNKGYASQLFEKYINGKHVTPGKVIIDSCKNVKWLSFPTLI